MLTVHRVVLEPGGGMLPPDHQRIIGMLQRIGAETP